MYIEGKLQTRKWQDKNGKDNWTTEIIANEMQMLDSRGGGSSDFNQSQGGGQQQSAPQSAPSQAAPAPANNDFDDDIPF